jgi:ABC-2 type transport system permease protein
MIKRIGAMLIARNLEFVRDRSSMSWNIVMPLILVFGLAFIFSGEDTNQFVVAVGPSSSDVPWESHPFRKTRFIEFVSTVDTEDAWAKIARHQLDMLIEPGEPIRYWINPESPAGYVVERLLLQTDASAERRLIEGTAIRYVDWLLPGVLGMNMMFSCLFGVGYVVVRYRKNGFLKRLQATPLRAMEFITAQALSRLLLTVTIACLVFVGVRLTLDIMMQGSYLALLAIAIVGGMALISMSLLIAARVASEELAGGLLNLLSWPMMLLSGVFFSLEGSPQWLQSFAQLLPLTQMLTAAREVMIDGAGIAQILPQLGVLTVMTAAFLAIGSAMFRWRFV